MSEIGEDGNGEAQQRHVTSDQPTNGRPLQRGVSLL